MPLTLKATAKCTGIRNSPHGLLYIGVVELEGEGVKASYEASFRHRETPKEQDIIQRFLGQVHDGFWKKIN